MCFPPWLPSLSPLPSLPRSLLVSLKKPARGWLHISHAKTFTHTSAPSLINHQAWLLGSGNTGKLYFYQYSPQTAPRAPPFLTVTPTGTSLGQRKPFCFGPISQVLEMVTDPGLSLPSIPPLSPLQSLGNSSSNKLPPESPTPLPLSLTRPARGAGGHH